MVELGMNREVPLTNLAMLTLKKMTRIRLVSDKKIVLKMLKLYCKKCLCDITRITTPLKEQQNWNQNISQELFKVLYTS